MLKAWLDHCGPLRAKHFQQRAIDRHPDEGDDFRPEAIDFLLENVPPLDVLRRAKHVDSGARPRDEVGDPEAPFRQANVVKVRDPLGYQARLEQQPPESIGRPRKVMARLSRFHARVDADEKHAHARRDSVSQPKVLPRGGRMAHDLWLRAQGGSGLIVHKGLMAHGSARKLEPPYLKPRATYRES